MWIEVGNRRCVLSRADELEEDWLREYLSFPDAEARFKPGSDGKIHLFQDLGASFPSGFLGPVQKAAADAGKVVELIDKRRRPCERDPEADIGWLFDYQREAVERVIFKGRGIVQIPTGGGKTEVAVALARALPTEWLFLVHRTSLGEQAAARFEMRNAEHGVDLGPAGVIGEGKWTEGPRFTAATFQTIAAAVKNRDPRALSLLGRVGGLVVDECHVLPASSFYDVASACDAYFRVGLSGTPLDRSDRKSIYAIAALGPVVHKMKTELLIERGVLAKAKIRMLTVSQAPNAVTWAGVYSEAIVRSEKRNRKILQIAKRAAKPSLLFVKDVKHGHKLAQMLTCNGVPADFVYGKHSTDYRKARVNALKRGALDVLVCSVIFQEGVDVPELRSVINASGSKSVIATLQRLGRGMRLDRAPDGTVREGGDVFEMWDLFDVGNGWLERHAKARRQAYVQEGHETIVEPETP